MFIIYLSEREEEGQQKEQVQEETNLDNDGDNWRDKSVIMIGGFSPDVSPDLDDTLPNPRKDLGGIRRAYTKDKKISLES